MMDEDYRLTLLRLECLLLLGHDIRSLELYIKDGRRDKVIRSMGRVIERLETEAMLENLKKIKQDWQGGS